MSEPDFTVSCALTLVNEGGSRYTDAEGDRGGPTRFGIRLATLSAYRKATCTAADVRSLTETEAQAIYRANYWAPLKCDQLGSRPVAAAVFDCGVLTGIGNAARQLQAAVGVVVDGQIGPKTLAAVAATDPLTLLLAFSSGLQAYLINIVKRDATQQVFVVGWLKRAAVMSAMPFLLP